MDDITELVSKWRKGMPSYNDDTHELEGRSMFNGKQCADMLESSLPTWTKITNNPTTWPEENVLVMARMEEYVGRRIISSTYARHTGLKPRQGVIHWRPLCSLDSP